MKDIASIFQSLDDETRLRILALLLEEDELCVCDLVSALLLPQSTVSRNLALLKNCGWLKDRKNGLWVYYTISRSLSPIHQFLIPVLRNFLPSSEVARTDAERLKSLSKGSSCA